MLYLSNFISDHTCQKSLGHFQNIMKNYSFLSISTITSWCTPPSAYNNVSLFLRHLALLCTKNFSVTVCTSSSNQHCLGGGGGKCSVQINNIQSVPGLLVSIVRHYILFRTKYLFFFRECQLWEHKVCRKSKFRRKHLQSFNPHHYLSICMKSMNKIR